MISIKKLLLLTLFLSLYFDAVGATKAQEPIQEEPEEISEIVLSDDEQESTVDDQSEAEEATAQDLTDYTIEDIIVEGNKQVSTAAILNKIPYRKGQQFDPLKTRELIRTLYFEFKRFRTINLMADIVAPETINLRIIVEEKIPLKEVVFEGQFMQSLKKKSMKKLTALETPAIDPEELKIFANAIKKLYLERGYYNATIDH